MKSPRVDLVIDRDKAAAVGLNATDIENALYDGLGPKWSSTIYGPAAQYQVLLELDPKYQRAGRLARTDRASRRRGRAGAARIGRRRSRRPSARRSINHSGQLPAVSISFGLRPGVSLGTAVEHVQQVANAVLPPTVTTELPGLGQGVPAVDDQPRPAALHRHRRRLHRARHAVRELHPPAHDSLGPAVGRPRARSSRCGCSATS